MHPTGCSLHWRSYPDARPLARSKRAWRSRTADTVRKLASSTLTNVDHVSLVVRNRGIWRVDEFQMNHLAVGPNAGIEVLVLELEGESQLRRVELNRFREIGCPELDDDVGNLHVDLP